VVEVGAPLPVESHVEIPSWGTDEDIADFLWEAIKEVTGLTSISISSSRCTNP
jgi:hypothetical protein